MQLRGARLCLDCEELHTADRCPICASEAFAYLTRWIPADEHRANRGEAAEPTPPAAAATTQPPGMSQWMARGAAGLVLVATGRWLWKSVRPMQWSEPSITRETRETRETRRRPTRRQVD